VGIQFIRKLFDFWKTTGQDYITFSECVQGIDGLVFSSLEERIDALFDIHDAESLGVLEREFVIQLSETLLFLLRLNTIPSDDSDMGDGYLASVSGLLSRCLLSNDKLGCDGIFLL
jgi:hypothetical protein